MVLLEAHVERAARRAVALPTVSILCVAAETAEELMGEMEEEEEEVVVVVVVQMEVQEVEASRRHCTSTTCPSPDSYLPSSITSEFLATLRTTISIARCTRTRGVSTGQRCLWAQPGRAAACM
jgi:hypothetical protein